MTIKKLPKKFSRRSLQIPLFANFFRWAKNFVKLIKDLTSKDLKINFFTLKALDLSGIIFWLKYVYFQSLNGTLVQNQVGFGLLFDEQINS